MGVRVGGPLTGEYTSGPLPGSESPPRTAPHRLASTLISVLRAPGPAGHRVASELGIDSLPDSESDSVRAIKTAGLRRTRHGSERLRRAAATSAVRRAAPRVLTDPARRTLAGPDPDAAPPRGRDRRPPPPPCSVRAAAPRPRPRASPRGPQVGASWSVRAGLGLWTGAARAGAAGRCSNDDDDDDDDGDDKQHNFHCIVTITTIIALFWLTSAQK